MKKTSYFILVFVLAFLISGCAMKWQPSWQAVSDNPTPQSASLLNKAQKAFNRASDEKSLLESIQSFENTLIENPGDYQALKLLSTQYILLGTAYTDSRQQKSQHFHQAMIYAEMAMYTNPDFRKRADAGSTPWEAAETLSAREVEAMFFWVTALQYEFKEGMSLPRKIINIDWLQHALVFLDRIEEVSPEFGDGAVDFAKVICYYALPKSKGGSKSLGDDYMRKAMARGDRWLFSRWARGKYYYPIQGEKDKARQDLVWVANQDIDQFDDPYPWRVYFQENASQLLR